MSDTTLNRFLARGTNAQRLAFTPSPPTPASGPSPTYIWYETDTGNTYAYDGAAWDQIASSGGGVTASGTLTANQLIIGGGGSAVAALGTLGTTTTLLHGNAAGAPTFAAVSLTADVTGDLPLANLAQASAASRLLGRGDSGAGDYQEIVLGTNLSMSGTTLNASGGAGSTDVLEVQVFS